MRITEFLGIYGLVDFLVACLFAWWTIRLFQCLPRKGIFIYREGNRK
jgi:hypothetical protein